MASNEHIPTQIGKYQVLGVLGRGATSRVYLGEDPFLGRRVAIKVIRDEAVTDTSLKRRFKRLFLNEASLAGKLAHPHIIAIYDAVTSEDDNYLVMEYVNGTTLEEYCKPDKLMAMERVVEIVFKAGLALDYAHRRGVIHCDIKPANILITGESDIKVTDFGAAFYFAADHTYLTGIGSPAYMSPEQVLEKQLTHQTDIYSMGVVLYQMLTGKLPFQASNRGSLVYQILNIEAVPPSVHRQGLPQELDRIVLRALAKKTEQRYGSWLDLTRDLAFAFRHLILPEEVITDTEKFSAVRALSFFREFRDMELWETLRASHWHRKAQGEVFLREGDNGDGFFILTTGKISVSRSGRVLDRLKPGNCFGEILYFNDVQSIRTTTITCQTACVAMEVKARTLLEASHALQAQFNRSFMQILVSRLERRETRIVGEEPELAEA